MEVDIISFDIDGTLIDHNYNDLIWYQALPEELAKKEKITFDQALKTVKEEYDRVGEKDYHWYDIKYWIKFFQLDIDYNKLLHKYEQEVRIFPEVPLVLSELVQKYHLICVSAMPREFMDIKLKRIRTYFQETFSTLSDYKQLKNKEIFTQIDHTLKVEPQRILHVGDHEQYDYRAALEAGWNVLLIDRYCSGFQEKYPDSVIYSLSDIINIIDIK